MWHWIFVWTALVLSACGHSRPPVQTIPSPPPAPSEVSRPLVPAPEPAARNVRFSMHWVPLDAPNVWVGTPECNLDTLSYFFGTNPYFVVGLEPVGDVEWRLEEDGTLLPHTVRYAKLKDGRGMSRTERWGYLNDSPQYSFALDFSSWDNVGDLHTTTLHIDVVGLPDGTTFGTVLAVQVSVNTRCADRGGSVEQCTQATKCVHQFETPEFRF